jgi:predicted Zn-dependent peptidase
VRSALLALAACASPAKPTPAPIRPPTPPPSEPAPPVEPADPAPVTDGDVTDAWVHGIHILVKRIPGAESTATHLYIRGGVRNGGAADAGIEELAIAASVAGGTERLDKDAFTNRLAELGSLIDGFATEDFSVVSSWSLTPAWDDTFALVVDAFRRPALPASEIELARTRLLASLRHEQETPDGQLGLLVRTVWRGHPYEHRPIGTLETVAKLTPEQLRAHLAKLRETSRLLLVVVGDIAPDRVLHAASAALGDLPRGSYADAPLPGWPLARGAATIVEAKLPTNYIEAVFPGSRWRDPDFAAAMVCMTALHHREFDQVRTRRNLSYAPSAYLLTNLSVPVGGLYVTAVDPIATMKVMLDEARTMREQPMGAVELAGIKATLVTQLYSDSETPGDQALRLARAELYTGDWRVSRTLADRVRAVTAADVQAWAAAHLTHLQSFVIGAGSKVDRQALEAF